MRDPRERLRDILEAIAAINRYRDRDWGDFKENELIQVWFLRHLQIIGEAASKLPEEVRNLACAIFSCMTILPSTSMLSGIQCSGTFPH